MRIRDIHKAAGKIVSHTQQLDFEAFCQDEWAVDAVLRNLTTIGEAARHIPDEVRSAYPEVPWAEMRDMRNIVVHEYFRVDLSIVWHAVRHELPALIPLLEVVLSKEADE